jgi:hypothetical protein
MMPVKGRLPGFAAMLISAVALGGCRAHVVKISLTNTSSQPIKTIIVDYPNATFGKDALAPGQTFSSIVKPVDTGAVKVQFTDASGRSHTYTGPALHKNDDGSIEIRFDQTSAAFTASIAGP